MMDFDGLDAAVLQVKTELEKEFPDTNFCLKPYYCGMGYCGINITIDKEDQIDQVTKYYDEHFSRKFFKRSIQYANSTDKHNEGEIFIAGKDKSYEALPIFRNVSDDQVQSKDSITFDVTE